MKKPPVKKMKEAIKNNNGFITNAALELGCTRQSLSIWIKEDESLTECLKECKEAMLDEAEGQLLKNIRDGKETSLLFFLKTQGRSRNYQQDGSELAAMTFNQLNISVRSEETKLLIEDVIKKISNE